MKLLRSAAFCALICVLSCTSTPGGSARIDFFAEATATRTVFTEPEGDSYPVRWTSDDKAVKISLNSTENTDASVHPSEDGAGASFSATFSGFSPESNRFYALSPASAFVSISDGNWEYAIPSVQTPLPGSPDPAAMVLSADSGMLEGVPAEVGLRFSHLTAYGLFNLENLHSRISCVTISWTQDGEPLTINTASESGIWFAVKPFDASETEVSFTVTTDKGSCTKSVLFPTGSKFEAGKIARFSVDFSDAVFTPSKTSINILAIGNSFSVDAMEYLYGFLKQAGYEDIFLGNLYIGGCTLERHAKNILATTSDYTYYSNSAAKWNTTSNRDAISIVKSRKWDIITLQQASGVSGMPDTYDPYMGQIISAVRNNCPGAELAWHMTWAYQADCSHSEFPNYGCVQIRMYNAIVNAVREKILPNDKFSFVIPSGTAVQNLRTSFSGDKLTRDGYHMSYKNGRAVTALMWAKQISGCPLGVIDLSSSGYNFSDDERDAIRDAVDKAYEHPFEVTPSAYPPQRFMHVSDPEVVKAFTDAGYDLSKYRELDYYINLWAFWNSTSSARYFSKDTGSSDPMTNHFACTGLFSSEDIPAGSVLVLKKGYQYRPDAWKRLSMANASSARPGNVVASNAPSVVKVDEEWWGSYAYRVFNLAEAGIPDLDQERMEALRSCLSIFVPKAE